MTYSSLRAFSTLETRQPLPVHKTTHNYWRHCIKHFDFHHWDTFGKGSQQRIASLKLCHGTGQMGPSHSLTSHNSFVHYIVTSYHLSKGESASSCCCFQGHSKTLPILWCLSCSYHLVWHNHPAGHYCRFHTFQLCYYNNYWTMSPWGYSPN